MKILKMKMSKKKKQLKIRKNKKLKKVRNITNRTRTTDHRNPIASMEQLNRNYFIQNPNRNSIFAKKQLNENTRIFHVDPGNDQHIINNRRRNVAARRSGNRSIDVGNGPDYEYVDKKLINTKRRMSIYDLDKAYNNYILEYPEASERLPREIFMDGDRSKKRDMYIKLRDDPIQVDGILKKLLPADSTRWNSDRFN
jgi:hypothetical protein